ncbi:MAG: flagellar basal-body rod protein FlgF [Bryobacteraceae bacterium]|jgi:flagellar basal-body rod protein FlgF
MDPLTSAAASGIRARIESLDMLANNIANASSPGFKTDRESFGLYLSSEAADSPAGTSPTVLPVTERQWTDFAQGSITPTGNQLDLALNGKGFLVANAPSGSIYTRDGNLQISKQGELETLDGYTIQGQDGKPIQVDSTKPVDIGPDGEVRQDGQDISQIAVVDFPNSSALAKQGNNYFRINVSTAKPVPAANAEIQQGKLEAANSQPTESAVRLVGVMRQFESLQKALAIGNEMNREVVQDVAKVSS